MNVGNQLIVLMTDFGYQDNYVGVMKGVIQTRKPGAIIIDLTHGVPPQDIHYAAYQLMTAVAHFPTEAFFICVVDPGVGNERKIIYVESAGRRFVAPDNGLLSWTTAHDSSKKIWDLSPSVSKLTLQSQTFHGRDVMAPLACQLIGKDNPDQYGTQVFDMASLPIPTVRKTGSRWQGEVIMADHFGNLISNVRLDEIKPFLSSSTVWIEFGNNTPPVRGLKTSFSEVEPGKLAAVAGSAGFVEIAARNQSAQKVTGLNRGDKIVLTFRT